MSSRSKITLAFACGLACCGERAAEQQQQQAVSPDQLGAVDSRQVVARVGGVPVVVDDLRAQLAGRPKTPPEEALQELISFELLAQEARRRKLQHHADVHRVQKQALANLYVRREHGDKFTKQSIPRDLVEQAYSLNKDRYQRPEMVRIAVLFTKIRKGDTPQTKRAARRLMSKALSVARTKRPSAEVLAGLRTTLAEEARDAGVTLDFARIDTARMGGEGQALTDTAFSMKPGTISKVVDTPRGYHLVYLTAKRPAVNKTLAEVEDEIRERIFDDARKMVFQRLLDKLWKKHRVEIFPEALQSTDKQAQAQRP